MKLSQGLERVDRAERPLPLEGSRSSSFGLGRGEALHRELRPGLGDDNAGCLRRMIAEGARLVQLVTRKAWRRWPLAGI